MELLVLDPGIRNPALSIFLNGTLVKASRVKLPGAFLSFPMAERCRRIAGECAGWWMEYSPTKQVDELVYEMPQIYRAKFSKGDPNDLPPLALVAGTLSGILGCPVVSYLPREWIGQVPKNEDGDPWASPRGQRIRERLSAEEIASIVVSHDSIDSVGIGLHHLSRLAKRRVYSRS